MRTIELTPKQIGYFKNPDWASPSDTVLVSTYELPSKQNPNPIIQYTINGIEQDSVDTWRAIPKSWQAALRKARQ